MSTRIDSSGIRWERTKTPTKCLQDLIGAVVIYEVRFAPKKNRKPTGKKKKPRSPYKERNLGEILSIEVSDNNTLSITVLLVSTKHEQREATFRVEARRTHEYRHARHLALQGKAHLVKYQCSVDTDSIEDFLCRRVAFTAMEAHLRFQEILSTRLPSAEVDATVTQVALSQISSHE